MAAPPKNFVALPGGGFIMGTDEQDGYPEDGEGPAHKTVLTPFSIGIYTVTNKEFGKFIKATSYQTEAEKFGWSFVFAGLLPDDFPATRAVAQTPWWRQVYGAQWDHPEGPQSSLKGRADHPAVHITWSDAVAYSNWIGGRLPTEAEWEYAARGNKVQKHYPWGNHREPKGAHRMNVWQGDFPHYNTKDDGFFGTAPVSSFTPNGFGLYNTTGNVWEWCADWFDPQYYKKSPTQDPIGPKTGEQKVMRGGSFLCHQSYCYRYRVDARSSNAPDASSSNMGFRVVMPL
jgi:formylglycine-generating enzyme required for sulfatase activity